MRTLTTYEIEAVVHMGGFVTRGRIDAEARCLLPEQRRRDAQPSSGDDDGWCADAGLFVDCGSVWAARTSADLRDRCNPSVEYIRRDEARRRARALLVSRRARHSAMCRCATSTLRGPRLPGERHDPETHLIPLVLPSARDRNASVTVFGRDYPTRDGTCVRDYVHVADLARAHVSALEALQAGEIEHDVFNLACGDGYTVQDVIEAAERVTGGEIPIVWGARRSGDPAGLVASAAKILRVLGWHPAPGKSRCDCELCLAMGNGVGRSDYSRLSIPGAAPHTRCDAMRVSLRSGVSLLAAE